MMMMMMMMTVNVVYRTMSLHFISVTGKKPVTNKRATLSIGMPPLDGQRTDGRKSMEKCILPRCDLDYRPLTIDREFEFYEFFSFLKFNEFYEFFFG